MSWKEKITDLNDRNKSNLYFEEKRTEKLEEKND